MKTKLVLALLFLATVAALTLLSAPSVQASDAKQIVFVMNGARFNRLEIKGYNQNGREVTWSMSGNRQIAVTSGWWWKDFVAISFDVPPGGCVIEGLWRGSGDYALITATAGQRGCTGASGNVYDPAKPYVEAWINGIYWKDEVWGNTVMGRLDKAANAIECMAGLASGVITSGCRGVAQEALNDIIKNAPRP